MTIKTKNKLEKLKEGNIFDNDELIVYREDNDMRTIRKMDDERIRRTYYCLELKKGKVNFSIINYSDFFKDDVRYEEAYKMLKEAKLC